MLYTIQHIAGIIGAESRIVSDNAIEQLVIDSRKTVFPNTSLFFAIRGERRDGHGFIGELYENGIRNFVVQKAFDISPFPLGNFLLVNDVTDALQQLARWHRQQFKIPVIGITGSNGKTIVKEWLYQLLSPEHNIVRSPRSYNSQLGVPLSIWQMNEQHTLAIFEAGISQKGEMEKLEAMIRPVIGVFTNIGDPHDEGFADKQEKVFEKIKLFTRVGSLVAAKDTIEPFLSVEGAQRSMIPSSAKIISWSRKEDATIRIIQEERTENGTSLKLLLNGEETELTIPFSDRISIDNAVTCFSVLFHLGYEAPLIASRIQQLEPVEMRMQLKKAVNNCYLLNDSYSNDLSSLGLALDYLLQQAGTQKTTLILSDILQSGLPDKKLYESIAEQVAARKIYRMICIGPAMLQHRAILEEKLSSVQLSFYLSTENFIEQLPQESFRDEYILLKGARIFSFERISKWLEQKVHQTVMEINLSAMRHNLKQYQQLLRPATKLMAMVKAFSYGSGSAEVARLLQFHKVDYLAVAYADEGVELRNAGISLPIMVMNADEAAFESLVHYSLEPEIFSFGLYHSFEKFLRKQGLQQYPVHIKFNTGMNRLGFETSDAKVLAALIHERKTMAIKSVFSHLAASESAAQDGFTDQQVMLFTKACDQLQEVTGYHFLRHIANTAAIFRKAEYQFDMVRLGIGLYGVESADSGKLQLQTVATLKTTIAQLRWVKAGDTVGYGRKAVLGRNTHVATVRIGYADGFGRELGNGKACMYLNGKLAPVIGNVCMDMTMIDVTDIPGSKEGDVVEVFGPNLPVQQVASWAGTIAYEILTGISQRVKRIYLEE